MLYRPRRLSLHQPRLQTARDGMIIIKDLQHIDPKLGCGVDEVVLVWNEMFLVVHFDDEFEPGKEEDGFIKDVVDGVEVVPVRDAESAFGRIDQDECEVQGFVNPIFGDFGKAGYIIFHVVNDLV